MGRRRKLVPLPGQKKITNFFNKVISDSESDSETVPPSKKVPPTRSAPKALSTTTAVTETLIISDSESDSEQQPSTTSWNNATDRKGKKRPFNTRPPQPSTSSTNRKNEAVADYDSDSDSETVPPSKKVSPTKSVADSDSDLEPMAKKRPSSSETVPPNANPSNRVRYATSTTMENQLGKRLIDDSDSEEEPLVNIQKEIRKRQSKVIPIVIDDSDYEEESTQRPNKRKADATATTSSSATPSSNDGYYAPEKKEQVTVKFLGHELKKTLTTLFCPYPLCGCEYATFTGLRGHFEKKHGLEKSAVRKPVNTLPNNLRRIQNSNKRFKLSTIKMKLSSFLTGSIKPRPTTIGQSPPSPTDIQRDETARSVHAIIEEQAVALSKLTILFTSLAYFRIYRLMDTIDANAIDRAFKTEFDWKKIILKLKTFQRATSNSKIPRSGPSALQNTLGTVDDTVFFQMCERFNVQTQFLEWSQNAWLQIVKTFRTNFKNNIKCHLFTRIRNWFRFRLRNGRTKEYLKENKKLLDDQIYHTMKYLFDFKKCSQPGKVQHKLIDELQKICQFPDFKSSQSYFRRLLKSKRKNKSKTKPAKKSKSSKKTPKKAKRLIWMQMVPAMIRLQKWIHSTNRNRQEVDDGTKKRKRKGKRKRKRKRNHDKTPADPKPATDQKPKPPQKRKRKGKRNNKNDKDKNIEGKKVHHEKLSSFKVVPQNDFSIKHFALDTKSLYDILKNLKAFEEDGKNLFQQNDFMDLDEDIEKTNAKSKNPFWNLLFKVNKFETKTKTFGSFITTNSSDVSIQYCQLRKDREMSREQLIDLAEKWKDQKDNATSDEESDEESESENEYDDASESESESDDEADGEANDKSKKGDVDPDIVEKLQKLNINLQNVSISGVDLGIRNTAATVIRTWENSKILESNVLHKAKDYHYKAGFGKRAKLQKKFVGDFDKKYKEDRQSAGEEPSSKNGDYIAYLTSRLKWFNRATDAYMQRRVTNLKFSKFVDTQKEMSQMANEIIGMNKKDAHIVFLGDCSTPSNSPIKGHMRSPTDKKIGRFLNQCRNTIVLKVDEFRTTKLCSRCFGELESVESSKDRLKICKKICKSLEDSTPANQISTMRSKQSLNQLLQNVGTKPTQYQRRQRLSMHRSERPSESDRIRIQARKSLRTTMYDGTTDKENGHWNRDINAARNIIYRGLCHYGQYIHQELTFRENTAFSRAPTRE